MKTRNITKALLLATIVAGTFLAGCELIVDFDRTRIPVDVSEASVADANVAETSTPAPDASDSDDDAGDAGDAGTADASDADADAG